VAFKMQLKALGVL